jgi:hypothetical protein
VRLRGCWICRWHPTRDSSKDELGDYMEGVGFLKIQKQAPSECVPFVVTGLPHTHEKRLMAAGVVAVTTCSVIAAQSGGRERILPPPEGWADTASFTRLLVSGK